MATNINKNNNKQINNEIHLSPSEMYSERPLGILTQKGFTLVVLKGALKGRDPKNLMVKDNFERLWTQALYRVAVDGGLDDLYELDRGSPSIFIPHTVCGDFDSLRSDTLEEYKKYGVEAIETPDQNKTDFTKAIDLVLGRISEKLLPDNEPIVCLGSCQMNRVDHQLAYYHTLLMAAERSPVPIYLIQDLSITRVLKKGYHKLHMDTGFEEGKIGIFPLDGETHVLTTGLKWNLDSTIRFGKMVSSSNKIESKTVEVTTSGPVVLTMTIGRPPSSCCGGGCS